MPLKTLANAERHNSPAALQREDRPLRTALTCVLIISFILEFIFWAAFLLSSLLYRTDFRHLYVAGYMVRSGHVHELYSLELQKQLQNRLVSQSLDVLPFNHLSFEAVLFVPFSFLTYRHAYFVWLIVNIGLLAAALRLLAPWIQPALNETWLAPAMFLLFLPVQVALLQGQDSILLLLILGGAFVLLSKNRDLAAGAVMAVGLFKFQIVLPIAALFLLKRRFRFSIAFAAASVALGLLSICMVGVGQIKLYSQLLTHMSLDSGPTGSMREAVVPADIAAVRGLISVLGSTFLNARVLQITALALSALLLLAVAFYVPRRIASSRLLAIFIPAGVLAGYHVLTHDMSIMLLPLLLVLRNGRRADVLPIVAYSAVALFSIPLIKFIRPHLFFGVSLFLLEFLIVMIYSARKSTFIGEPQ